MGARLRYLLGSSRDLILLIWRSRRILLAVTRVELAKRYSGSAFGWMWIFLFPVFLLAIYLFVFLVVFQARFPGFSRMDYALYVFCGLVPFLGVSEAINSGCVSLKQNMHLIKNVMLPIELVPIRAVLVSLASQLVGLGMVVVLLGFSGMLSGWVALMPVVLLLQALFLVGLVLVLASLAVALPDITHLVNLAVMMLMFLSPIGFKPEMVPPLFQWVLHLNPVYYLATAFRAGMIRGETMALPDLGVFVVISLAAFVLGAGFFRRFKGVLTDYE